MTEVFRSKDLGIIWQAPKQEQKTQHVPLITDYHGPQGDERIKAIAQSKRLQLVREAFKNIQEEKVSKPHQFNYST